MLYLYYITPEPILNGKINVRITTTIQCDPQNVNQS